MHLVEAEEQEAAAVPGGDMGRGGGVDARADRRGGALAGAVEQRSGAVRARPAVTRRPRPARPAPPAPHPPLTPPPTGECAAPRRERS